MHTIGNASDDQGLVSKGCYVDDFLLSQRMLFPKSKKQWLARGDDRCDVRLVDYDPLEHRQHAALAQRGKELIRHDGVHGKSHVGVGRMQVGQQARDVVEANRPEHTDVDATYLASAGLLNSFNALLTQSDDLSGISEQDFANLGQRDTAWRSSDELGAHRALHELDLTAECRLAEMQPFRGAADVTFFGDRNDSRTHATQRALGVGCACAIVQRIAAMPANLV
jgi:hypothetical protein